MINSNRTLRTSADATVNEREIDIVLADATSGPIALSLIAPAGYGEYWLRVENTGTGDAVTLTPLGGKTINGGASFVLAAGEAAIIGQDDLSELHVFGSAVGGSSGGWEIPAGVSVTYAPTDYAGTGSFQPIGPDLNLDPAAGSSTDPKYIATGMFNIFGDALTKTKTYIAAVIAKLSITGVNNSTYPRAAIAAEIGDGVTAADGAVVAVLGGDSAQTNARAAFTVDNQNSTGGSGFDYGVDLAGPGTHDGYPAVSYLQADIRFSDGTTQSTAPLQHQATITLTNAQILTLPTLPVEVLPAPGPNKYVLLQFGMLHLKWTADYTNINATATLNLDTTANYNTFLDEATLSGISALLAGGGPDGTWVPILPQILAQSSITTATPAVDPHFHRGVSDSGSYDSDTLNKPITISMNNQGSLDLTGGHADNELQISLLYYILDANTGLFE